jgi:hypothetical protein
MRGPDWVLPVKLTVLAAMLLWGLLIFAPAATLSWALDARTLYKRRWLAGTGFGDAG